MSIKIVFYLKGNRTVTLTDDEEKSLSTIKDQIMNVIKKDNFCSFVTKTDSITLKPTEIVGFHLLDSSRSKDKNFSNVVENDFDYDFKDIIEEVKEPVVENKKEEEQLDVSLFQIMNEEANDVFDKDVDDIKIIEEKEIPNIDLDDADIDLREFISESDEYDTENIYEDTESEKGPSISEDVNIEEKETINEAQKKKEKKSNVKINKGTRTGIIDKKENLIQKIDSSVRPVYPGASLTNTAESIQQIIGREDMLTPPRGNRDNNPLDLINDPKIKNVLAQQSSQGNLKINLVAKK